MALQIVFLLFLWGAVQAKKILVLPYQSGSHIRGMAVTGRELAERGHQVFIANTQSQKQPADILGKMEQILYGGDKEPHGNPKEIGKRVFHHYRHGGLSTAIEAIRFTIFELQIGDCSTLLADKKFYKTAKELGVDLVLIDGLPVLRCFYIFVHGLGVPYVTQTAIYPMDLNLFSYFVNFPFSTVAQGQPPAAHVNSDVGKLGYFQRVFTSTMHIINHLVLQLMLANDYDTYKNYSEQPLTKSQYTQLAAGSKLWLIEQHPLLDFPRPRYDHFKLIGGVNWTPAKPLEGEVAKIADAAKAGFILVSLGGDLLYMPEDFGDKLASAFRNLPEYTIFWANKGRLSEPVPQNVVKLDWLPQNDLLGHPNCVLMVTHCGNGGQLEAVSHGIPMLGIPIHRDQPLNAWRIVDRGYGLAVNLNTANSEDIAEKITEIITKPKYKSNIMNARAVFHDVKRKPVQTAADWVEHALNHDTAYLKSDAMQMSWYQVLGYDIMAFFVGVFLIFITFLVCVCKCVCICRRTILTKEKKD